MFVSTEIFLVQSQYTVEFPRIDLVAIIIYYFHQRPERLHRACISNYAC